MTNNIFLQGSLSAFKVCILQCFSMDCIEYRSENFLATFITALLEVHAFNQSEPFFQTNKKKQDEHPNPFHENSLLV